MNDVPYVKVFEEYDLDKCPYCLSDINPQAWICKSCNKDIKLVLQLIFEYQKLKSCIPNDEASKKVPKIELKKRKVTVANSILIYYTIAIIFSGTLILTIPFSKSIHPYQYWLYAQTFGYIALMVFVDKQYNAWILTIINVSTPILSGLFISLLIYSLNKYISIDIVRYADTLTYTCIIIGFVSLVFTLLLTIIFRRTYVNSSFSIKPFFDWMIPKEEIANMITRIVVTITSFAGIVYSFYSLLSK